MDRHTHCRCTVTPVLSADVDVDLEATLQDLEFDIPCDGGPIDGPACENPATWVLVLRWPCCAETHAPPLCDQCRTEFQAEAVEIQHIHHMTCGACFTGPLSLLLIRETRIKP